MVVAVVALAVALAALAWFVLPGLSSARPAPPQIELAVAGWLLRHSVPEAARAQRNPLAAEPRHAAGAALFREKCEVCHGYDGGGKTEIGGGEYPRPPALRSLVSPMSDGEIFYHIRNGIRNTGMPAWELPDREIWQLVTYHPPSAADRPDVAAVPAGASVRRRRAHYVGSAACK